MPHRTASWRVKTSIVTSGSRPSWREDALGAREVDVGRVARQDLVRRPRALTDPSVRFRSLSLRVAGLDRSDRVRSGGECSVRLRRGRVAPVRRIGGFAGRRIEAGETHLAGDGAGATAHGASRRAARPTRTASASDADADRPALAGRLGARPRSAAPRRPTRADRQVARREGVAGRVEVDLRRRAPQARACTDRVVVGRARGRGVA